jgi:hypothetical protein
VKLLLDINVFMDVFERRQGWMESLALIVHCRQKRCSGHISALTIPILYYLRRKRSAESQAREDTFTITAGIK